MWSESLRAEGAETLASYTHGLLAGSPAPTSDRFGAGQGWYPSKKVRAGRQPFRPRRQRRGGTPTRPDRPNGWA
ncbi:beta-galactosidase trimerization domain-containing protein [Streptacidiphilus sp. EB103A]|uniref:beta-galactosidase trimerization domain-containing protein n=1 Tax=Streptacidiphilus sp. EB103A TaxID=3156275 RepID=UPI0035196A8A